MSEPDNLLLAEFNARRSEEAFAALVRQHIHLVFATALRQVGDRSMAEEITQNVFVALAQSSSKLNSHPTIAGWLHQTTLNKSRERLRTELRRRRREQIAVNLELAQTEGESVWSPLVPLLDEALLKLREPDRLAVILHFMEGRTFKEVGSALGIGEDAARKRTNRCLDQLTDFFRRRGFAMPALAAGAPIFALSSHATTAELAASATTAGLAAHSATSTSALTLIKGALKIMAWSKAKTAIIAGVVVLLAAGTTTITIRKIEQHKADESWRIRPFDSRVLDWMPPQVEILPAKLPRGGGWGSGMHGKMMGTGVGVETIVQTAYGFGYSAWTIVSTELPKNKYYDFVASLPSGNAEALQQEIKKQFGVVGRRETIETNVLLLEVKYLNAQGLRPSTTRSETLRMQPGQFSGVNIPISDVVGNLEGLLQIPVIDQTGIASRFDIDLKWNRNDPQHNGLKQALIDQLGLELVPTNLPVEMLVVEKAK